jgi:hypothetical protein
MVCYVPPPPRRRIELLAHELTEPTALFPLLFKTTNQHTPTNVETKKEYSLVLVVVKSFQARDRLPLPLRMNPSSVIGTRETASITLKPWPGRLASPRLAPCRQGEKATF